MRNNFVWTTIKYHILWAFTLIIVHHTWLANYLVTVTVFDVLADLGWGEVTPFSSPGMIRSWKINRFTNIFRGPINRINKKLCTAQSCIGLHFIGLINMCLGFIIWSWVGGGLKIPLLLKDLKLNRCLHSLINSKPILPPHFSKGG